MLYQSLRRTIQLNKPIRSMQSGLRNKSKSPRSNSFKPKDRQTNNNPPRTNQPQLHQHIDLNSLNEHTPIHIQQQAFKSYQKCKLSSLNPIIRFSVVRKMRLLDLPPHQSLWQSINSKDEINLYNWINEAFGQLLYIKKLWIPSNDWNETDDRIEKRQLDENLEILKDSFQKQILRPLKSKYGEHLVESNINQLIKSQYGAHSLLDDDDESQDESFLKPAIIWRTRCAETGEEVIEWMSEKTSDVVWPGLVSLNSNQTIARRYWESEARKFAKQIGGIAKGLGKHGEMLEIDEEIGEPCDYLDESVADHSDDTQLQEVINTAEGILIKEFIEERSLHSP